MGAFVFCVAVLYGFAIGVLFTVIVPGWGC
jgi:hypothetical protein